MNYTFLGKKTLVALCLFLIFPIVIMSILAFFSADPLNGKTSLSLSGFRELLTLLRVNELLKISGRAMIVCLSATTISFLISYALILYTSKTFQSIFFILITLPFLANESVRVFSWQYVLSENGLFNQVLSILLRHQVTLFNGSNSLNVYLVMILTCVPFGIFINSASLQTIPGIYWKASNDLNINSFGKFYKVALPLSKFAILASIIVIFFISFSLSGEVNFLGGDSKISIRNLVLSLMSASKFQAIFVLGFVTVLCLLVLATVYRTFNLKSTKTLK